MSQKNFMSYEDATEVVSEIASKLSEKVDSSAIGTNGGIAELDSTGKVPSSQLPSFVDDVLEYDSLSNFPATGEAGKIYVAKDTNKTYRWSGSAYVEISPSLALGETSSTAYRGDRGKTAYTHATDGSRLTTATASGLYKVASTAQGHIAGLTAVTKADITGLGIPGSDTNTTYTFANGTNQFTVTPSGGSAQTVKVTPNDSTKLPLAGGTMTGQILTSFKSAVAMGSRQSDATTIENLCNELRYSSGCAGSVSTTAAYTKDGITIPAGWYNYLWIPHRSGGVNGNASGDNCNYGSLLLSGMTLSGCYMLRYAGSKISELKNLYTDNNTTYNLTNNGSSVRLTGSDNTNKDVSMDTLLSNLPGWTATANDDTYFIRRDTGGTAAFGQVKFSTLWSYIKGKTDSAYAAASHTHNYAGSSSAGGSATSALKLDTARSIALGTDFAGSANFDGSANITINGNFYWCTVNGGNTANYPWHRIAYCSGKSGQYTDTDATFIIRSRFDGGGFGILKVSLRTNNSGAACSTNARWLYRTGYATDSVVIAHWGTTGQSVYADIFLRCGKWPRTVIYQIVGDRAWTLVSSNEVDNTTASDKKGSKECYVSVASAATEIHNQSYTSTKNSVDSGTVNYANNAGTVNGKTVESNVPANAKFTEYGTCSTAAGTAAKVVSSSKFSGLAEGVVINVKFTNDNTADSPTLNVNSTGAKAIWKSGGNVKSSNPGWMANEVVSFTYDGTRWIMNDVLSSGRLHTQGYNNNCDTIYMTCSVNGRSASLGGLLRITKESQDIFTIGAMWTNIIDAPAQGILINQSTKAIYPITGMNNLFSSAGGAIPVGTYVVFCNFRVTYTYQDFA